VARDIKVLAKEKWESSGLTDEHAAQLKFEVLDGKQVALLGTNFKKAGALKLPYFDTKGKPTKFYRIRYLESLPGFSVAKPQRYAQLAGTLNEVYLPPILNQSWEEILADPNVPIYFTEGELKAAAGCVAGLATVGLGGVDVWRSNKRGIGLLPVLDAAEWNQRSVVIIYDSDASTNENVVRAQRQLARELCARGAMPAIASLPPGADGVKQGLDDFLVAKGPESLMELLQEAPGFPEAEALWEMNEEVAYVRDPGLVVVRGGGQRVSPANFVSHAYANRHYLEIVQTKKGVTTVKKPLAKRWLEWERRFELEKITYAPGQPQLVDACWNTWPGWGVTPRRGDVKPWHDLLDYVFRHEDPAVRRWFERWCAYPLQHPGTKLFCASVLWGTVHGTGKTLVGYTLRNIYGRNAVEIKDQDLRGGFNEWAENKQFVIGDEVTGSDRRAEADRLKGLITQEFIRINAKYVPSFTLPDCVNYYFTSNHPDAFFLEDTDRRFFIHEIIGSPMSAEFYARYDAWLRGDGPAFLFDHLLNLDLGDFNPRAPAITTTAKKQMIVDNKSDLGMWVHLLREDPTAALRPLGDAAAVAVEVVTPDLLFRAYDPEKATNVTINGLARELKRAGFRQVNVGVPVKTSAGLKRMYAIRNVDKWENAKPKEISEHYEKFFNPANRKF
jgi:hypothetical protein